MDKEETLQLVREQLDGLANAVANDKNFEVNKEDYQVTINSLRKRIVEAKKLTGEPPMAGTKTGRMSSKNPNVATIPKNMTPKQRDAAFRAMNPRIYPPVTDRRAAIEHTRKLNELGNDS